MITRVVKLTLKEGLKQEFLDIYRARNPKKNNMEGCISVRMFEPTIDSHEVFTISEWENEDYLNLYRETDYFKESWSMLKPLFTERAEAWSLQEIL